MKKLIFIAITLVISIGANAQTQTKRQKKMEVIQASWKKLQTRAIDINPNVMIDTIKGPKQMIYMEFMVNNGLLSNGGVSYNKSFKEIKKIKDENDNIIYIFSYADAITYFIQYGWEYVNTYVDISSGVSGLSMKSGSTGTVIVLMKRMEPVPDTDR